MKYILHFLFLFFVWLNQSQAQSLSLVATPTTPDTLYIGTSYFIAANLTNVGAQPFNDTIDFAIENGVGVSLATPSVFSKPPYSGTVINLLPGESIPAYFNVDIDGGYFAPGQEVVVIWPMARPQYPVVDSIKLGVYIEDDLNSLFENQSGWSILQNGHLIFIKNEIHNSNVEQVRIFNPWGQCILTQKDAVIDTQDLISGIYFIEISTRQLQRSLLKWIK